MSTPPLSDEENIRLNGVNGLDRFANNPDFMSPAEAENLRMFSEYGQEEFAEAAQSNPEALSDYLGSLLSSLSNITDKPVVQYLILLLDTATEALQHTPAFKLNNSGVLGALARITRDEADVFCLNKATAVLSRFASAGLASDDLVTLHLGWIQEKLAGGAPGDAGNAALSSLMICLSRVENRERFVSAGGISLLVDVCKSCSSQDSQRQYGACFCLWVLSYLDSSGLSEFGRSGAVTVLCDLIKSTREKVTRVCAQALRNLVEVRNGEFIQLMLDAPNELLATTTMLLERHWGDTDVLDTINELTDVLRKNYRVLTSFEKYQKQIDSGELVFGPVHTEKFWRENVSRFSANEFKIIKTLVGILEATASSLEANKGITNLDNSEAPPPPSLGSVAKALAPSDLGRGMLGNFEAPCSDETVAVACYDLGEFVRFFPAGKNMAKTLGVKYTIMKLLEQHPSSLVKENALESVSKMMVGNWQAISSEA